MPYRTPFDETNEHYKNKTGPYAPRPSAGPSALDLQIAAAAAKALEKMKGMTNPVNNVREIDRRSGQAAAQDRALLGARPDFSPTPGFTPEKGTFKPTPGFTPENGAFRPSTAFRPDRGAFTPAPGTFAASRYAPEKGTFKPSFAGEIKQGLNIMGQGFSAAGRHAVAPLKDLFQTPPAVQEQNAYNRVMGIRTSAEDPNFRGVNAQRAKDGQASPLSTGQPSRFGTDMWKGAKMVGTGFADAARGIGRNIGPALEKINRGPQGETWIGGNNPSQATASPTARPTPADSLRTSPSKDRDPASAPAGGDPGKGAPKPGTVISPTAKTNARGESTYVDMINAGPEAQAKFIKDANLVHMIRGTDQTWGNPKIQGDLGVKEFKSALEAAAGVDRAEALAKHAVDTEAATELAKERIKGESGRYHFEKVVTEGSGGAEEVRVFDTKTRSWVEDGSEGERQFLTDLAQRVQRGEAPPEEFDKLNTRQQSLLREIIAGFQNSK